MGKRLTTEEFIEKAKLLHDDKFDYSKVEYVNNTTNVCIICPIHGEFLQKPVNHLNGNGCFLCGKENSRKKISFDTETYVNKCVLIHGKKYNYSKVNYINCKTKICIICQEHGEFWMTPDNHFRGQGCPKCKYIKFGEKYKKNINDFINESNLKHNNFYVYSKVKYHNCDSKICIICPIHGEFFQTPNHHLNGTGCPHCKSSKLEKNVANFLDDNEIIYERQKRFKWLGLQSLDFYIPSINLAIECQGIQHFESKEFFGGDEEFEHIKERDQRKLELCNDNGVKLLYFSNLGIDYPYEVFEDEKELLIEINKVLQWV